MKHGKGLCAVAIAVVLALAVAACGGSSGSKSSSSSSGGSSSSSTSSAAASSGGGSTSASLASATALISSLEKRPTQIGITTPISGKPPKGKTIDFLACGAPACTILEGPLQTATAALGWHLRIIVQGNTAESVKAAWDQVVANPPDAVITTAGFPHQFFQSELSAIDAKGIPVIAYSDTDPSGQLAIVYDSAFVNYMGQAMADWIAVKTHAKANVLFVYTSAYSIQVPELAGFRAQFAKVCPSCKLTAFNAPATAIGANLPSLVSQEVQSHPGINYIVAGFGDLALGLPSALAGVGSGSIPIVTANQSDVGGLIKKGQITGAFVTSNGEIISQAVDILIRHFLHEPIAQSTALSAYSKWFVTPQTIPSATANYPSVPNYSAQFEKLWNIG